MSWCLAVSHVWPTLDKPFWLDVGNTSLSHTCVYSGRLSGSFIPLSDREKCYPHLARKGRPTSAWWHPEMTGKSFTPKIIRSFIHSFIGSAGQTPLLFSRHSRRDPEPWKTLWRTSAHLQSDWARSGRFRGQSGTAIGTCSAACSPVQRCDLASAMLVTTCKI